MTAKLVGFLKNQARYWAGQMTIRAKAYAPNHVKNSISSKVEEVGEGRYIIRTTADRRIAPDARAQEYGSGLRARRGVKRKYIIKPKNKKLLAFYWDVLDEFDAPETVLFSPKFTGFAPDGRATFRYVEHPGIQAANGGKGYIAPAAKDLRKRIKESLKKGGADAIRADIGRSLRVGFGKK